MKKILTIIIGFLIISVSLFSQQCNTLGCADQYSSQNATNQTIAGTSNLGCITASRQVFWQYFFCPTGGNFTQAFTPSGTQDLDWVVFDMGTTSPTNAQLSCYVSSAGWTQTACNNTTTNAATGPGIDGTVTTTALHYYAIAVSVSGGGNYTFTIGTPQIGSLNLIDANCLAWVLPLKLISFRGNINNGNGYSLSWETANEINVSHIEVLSSHDGRNWQTTGNVTAKNNSGGTNFYNFEGNALVKGILYLKLKIVGIDGKFTYSSTVVLKSRSKNIEIVNTGINPVNEKLNYIIYAAKPTSVSIAIIDFTGRKMKEKKINLAANNNTISIELDNLLPGSYFIKITDPSGKNTIVNYCQKG